jgi:tetratricopeptide (TPR) repeat protein
MVDDERSMEMDELTAHLDRGWDLLGRGDLAGARVSADHILRMDSESPEGHTLLGAIANAEGDPEEAFELFRRALDYDPEYLEAMIYGAEVAVNWLDDPEAALRLCGEAEELLEPGEEELIDVELLRAEAQLAMGATDEALRTVRPLSERSQLHPAHLLRLGRLLVEVGEPALAVPLLTRGIEQDESDADPHYFLASALEQQGDAARALEHFLHARRLDEQRPPPSWLPTPGRIAEITREQLAQLPEPLKAVMAPAVVQVREVPPPELIAEGVDPRAVAFVSAHWGQAEPERRGARAADSSPGDPRITAVFVYRRNLERVVGSAAGLADEIRQTVAHEAVAVLGIDGGGDSPD